jgi:hypothetical protein
MPPVVSGRVSDAGHEDESCARAGLAKISVGSSFLGGDWLNDEADYEAPTRLLAGGRLSLDRVRS